MSKRNLSTKILICLFVLVFGAVSIFLKDSLPSIPLENIGNSFIAFGIIYFLIWVLLASTLKKFIKDPRSLYTMRKTIKGLFFVLVIAFIIRIWVKDPESILVAYGLVGAGVAISLSDFFKNIAGGVILFVGGMYYAGDRIEIAEKKGDVIDVGLLYTTIIEIGEWVDGDQSTGRLISIPNGLLLTNSVHNYTKDHSYLWDEIFIPLTQTSNVSDASKIFLKIALEETQKYIDEAAKSLENLGSQYYISSRNIVPTTYVSMTDNWIDIRLRYVVYAWDRRGVRSKIFLKVIEEVKNRDDIHIASESLALVNNE
jgi:small-conductance mechanosensitive channel